jgi:urease gamma subunit
MPVPQQIVPARRGGRPTAATDELKHAIIEGISSGKTVVDLMPELGFNAVSLLRWRRADDQFRNDYIEAMSLRTEMMAEELIRKAQTVTDETASAVRVSADILKWVMSKMKPKEWGDKAGQEEPQRQVMVPTINVIFGKASDNVEHHPENIARKQIEAEIKKEMDEPEPEQEPAVVTEKLKMLGEE